MRVKVQRAYQKKQLIDFYVFDDNTFVMCGGNVYISIFFYNPNLKKLEFKTCLNCPNGIEFIRCFVIQEKKLVIFAVSENSYFRCKWTFNFDVISGYFQSDNYLRDVDFNSKYFICLTRKIETSSNLIHIYDHDLKFNQEIDTKDLRISGEIRNLKVNENYLIAFSELNTVTLINIVDKSIIREFKIDGTQFSVYNESLIVSYNQNSRLIRHYDLDGKEIGKEILDKGIEFSLIRGSKKGIVCYNEKNNEYFFLS